MDRSTRSRRLWWAWALCPALLLLVSLPGPRPPRADHADEEAALRPGLAGRFRDPRCEVRMAPSTPQFRLAAGQSVHPSLGPLFDAEWNGFVRIPARGQYVFTSEARVTVDGQQVQGRPVSLPAGDLVMQVQFQRREDRPVRLSLRWASDTLPEQPVPDHALWHRPTRDLDAFASVERGRALAQNLRCFQCHRARADRGRRWRAPDLTHVGGRVHGAYLMKWLRQPRNLVAHATMPALPLSAQDRRDVVTYLTGLSPFPADQLGVPAATVLAEGERLHRGLGCIACHDEDRIPLDHLSRKTTIGPLTEYLLDPRTVHPDGAMPALFLQPDQDIGREKVRARKVAWYLLRDAPAAFAEFEPGDAARGEALVFGSGCLACHTLAPSSAQRERALGDAAAPAPPTRTRPPAPALAAMILFGGCLDGDRPDSAPYYRLEARERDDLVAYLRWLRDHPDRSVAPVHALEQSVESLHCVACHEWREHRPRPLFPHPAPPLTGAGRREDLDLAAILGAQRQRSREGPGLRMPHFGPVHGRTLFQGLRAAAVGAPEVTETPTRR